MNAKKFYLFYILYFWCFGLHAEQISKIRVEGNRIIQEEAILHVFPIKPGQSFDLEDVDEGLKNIFELGYFEDVLISQEDDVLVIKVVEKPRIMKLDIKGSTVVDPSLFKDKMQSKEGTIFQRANVHHDVNLIEEMYRSRGYHLVKVECEEFYRAQSEVEVIFRIESGDLMTIENVSFSGNYHFSEQELGKVIQTQRLTNTAWLTQRGMYREQIIEVDRQRLEMFYKDQGFADVVVTIPQLVVSPDLRYVSIHFLIDEGQRYKFGTIQVSGEELSPELMQEIHANLSCQSDRWFSITRFQKDLKLLQRYYGNEGYAFVAVNPLTETLDKPDAPRLNVNFQVVKGPMAYYRRVSVQGHQKTRLNVILRQLEFSEGQRYHYDAYEESRENLMRLGYFESVDIELKPTEEKNSFDALVKVKEQSSGSFMASMGVSARPDAKGANFMTQVSYQEANFIGKGWQTQAHLNLTPGQKPPEQNHSELNYDLGIGFVEPSLNDGLWSFSIGGKYSRNTLYDYDEFTEMQIRRGYIGLGRRLSRYWRFHFELSHELSLSNPLPFYLVPYRKHGHESMLTQSLRYNRLNNSLAPTSGTHFSVSHDWVPGHMLGQNYAYGKINFSYAYYIPVYLFEKYETNFRIAFEPAFLYSLNGIEIPYWRRFQLGNAYNMKGFLYDPIHVERVSVQTGEGQRFFRLGGTQRWYGALEYFFPIIPEANLRGVLFAELGMVTNDWKSSMMALSQFGTKVAKDVGFGFRIRTPIAPFRFEWAFPIESQNGKPRLGNVVYVFSVGGDDVTYFGYDGSGM